MKPEVIVAIFGAMCLSSSVSAVLMMASEKGDGASDDGGGGGLLNDLFGGGGDDEEDEDAGGGGDDEKAGGSNSNSNSNSSSSSSSNSSSSSSSSSSGTKRPSLFPPAGKVEKNDDGSTTTHHGGGRSTTTWVTEKKVETPVDCKGYWSEWGGCSSKCEGGKEIKTWKITTWPKGTGKACPSPLTKERSCGSGPCSVRWGHDDSVAGSNTWEEYPDMKLSGTVIRGAGGKISLEDCKQQCVDNQLCAGITTKTSKRKGTTCTLFGGDALPNPSASWWKSYTLVR